MTTPVGPVLKWPGAKWRMAAALAASLPAHTTYLEPFFGSGALFFAKERSKLDVLNDLNADVVNLFRVLRDHPDEIASAVALTPYARTEHDAAWADERCGDAVEDARRFLIRAWMNHGASGARKGGWANATGAVRDTSAIHNRARYWAAVPGRIVATAERLLGVQIECSPALALIARYAHPACLIYADPPYPLALRKAGLYACEMTDDDHMALLAALDTHPGPVVLSGYACALYDERLGHWQRETLTTRAQKAQARTEVIWRNAKAARLTLEGLSAQDAPARAAADAAGEA